MSRKVLGVLIGVVAWVLLGSIAVWILGIAWPAYAAAVQTQSFTLSMLFARLAIGALAVPPAARASVAVSRDARAGGWTGATLLLLSAGYHTQIWDQYPVWYHLIHLAYLAPLGAFGTRIDAPRTTEPRASRQLQ